jgi:hypothetical protein
VGGEGKESALMTGSRRGWVLAGVLGLVFLVPAGSAGQAADRPASSSSGPYGTVAVGLAARDDSPMPPAVAPSSAARTRSLGVRVRRASVAAGAAPSASATALSATPFAAAAGTLVNFNGVSSRDSAATNFGAEVEPPDQGLCVGNGFVVEMVNSAYSVYDTSGKLLAGPFNVGAPFNEGDSEFVSDPRCHYDRATNTWFATVLTLKNEETTSSLDIAVNTSGDPRTRWTAYKVNTTGLGGASGPHEPGCPCFGDQPTLGIDPHNVYITTNDYSILGPQDNGAQVYAFAKRDLVTLSEGAHYVHFGKLKVAGIQAELVQPALTTGKPAAEYFLNSLDPNLTFDNRIGVWALTEPSNVAKGGVPKLSNVVLTSEPYGVPPQGEQKGASSLIEAGDDRMQQTQFINGSIWGELGTAVNLPNDPQQRAAAAWFEVRPTLSGGVISAAHMKRQGYVGVPGNYVMYPALQTTSTGAVGMVASLTGAKRYPSAAYALLAPAATEFGPVTVAAPGTGPYDPTGERWGDYSWAVLDPNGQAVWMATEYVPPKSSQTSNGLSNWGTRVFEVQP